MGRGITEVYYYYIIESIHLLQYNLEFFKILCPPICMTYDGFSYFLLSGG